MEGYYRCLMQYHMLKAQQDQTQRDKAKSQLNKEFLEVVECSYDTWVSYDDTTRSQAILDQLRPEKGGFISHEEFEEKMKSGEYLRPRKRARETNQ